MSDYIILELTFTHAIFIASITVIFNFAFSILGNLYVEYRRCKLHSKVLLRTAISILEKNIIILQSAEKNDSIARVLNSLRIDFWQENQKIIYELNESLANILSEYYFSIEYNLLHLETPQINIDNENYSLTNLLQLTKTSLDKIKKL